jgi:UDP:flavonoid glycosyltransferase YjiC (YdhE family)
MRIVKRFETEKAARAWAVKFEYARSLTRLAPLRVELDGVEWVVINPQEYPRTPVTKGKRENPNGITSRC